MNLKLGEFAKIKGGKRMPSGTPLVSYRTDHPYLRIVDFKDGSIDRSNLQYVPNEVFPAISRYVISSKDLYISIVGTIGLVGTVPPDLSGANLTENAAKICEIDSSLINRDYLGYFLRSEVGQAEIRSLAVGSTQPKLALFRIEQIAVPCPPLEVQLGIASLLGALDDRITLLRETNTTLEAIAQALFKSWFIDFDPVRAKAEGRQPEGAIQGCMSAAEGRMPKAAMDATTAALFPDSFEESELGLVPKGWSIGCVGDLANQKKGSVNPLASPEVLFEHYSLPAFDSDQAPVFELGQQIKSNKTPLPDEAVLLSKLNPHIPRVWLPVNHGANAVCSTEFLAYSPQEGVSKELIYCLFVAAEFQQQLCQLVTGTSNSHQRVKPDQVLLVKIPIADKPVLKAFAELAKPLFERVHANRQQAQTLTQLRDTLLPRLISGQLRLPEAESLMEKAL
tara:strand:+ start:80 stop:1432 length:1353 start_codon:yes stop_codon:yes gene_type:complete